MLKAITILSALVLEHEGNWKEIFTHIILKERPNKECLEQAEKKLQDLEEQGYRNLCLADADYPQNLKQLEKPPFLISIRDEEVIKEGRMFCSKDIIVHLGYQQEEEYLKQIFKLLSLPKFNGNESFKEKLKISQALNLNICDLLVADEVEAEPTFYNISEEQFEQICKLVQRAYLKADDLAVWQIVKALAKISETKKIEDIDIWELIREACNY